MVMRKEGFVTQRPSGLQMRNNSLSGGLVNKDNPDDFKVKGKGTKKSLIKYDNPDDVDI